MYRSLFGVAFSRVSRLRLARRALLTAGSLTESAVSNARSRIYVNEAPAGTRCQVTARKRSIFVMNSTGTDNVSATRFCRTTSASAEGPVSDARGAIGERAEIAVVSVDISGPQRAKAITCSGAEWTTGKASNLSWEIRSVGGDSLLSALRQ